MRPAEDIKRLIKNLTDKTSAQMDERVLKDVLSTLEESEKNKSALVEPNIRRIIMKSRITKFAAAAVIIIAVLIGVHRFGNSMESVAFADVLENVRNSKTLTYLVRNKGEELPIMKVMAIDPHLLRFEFLSEQMPKVPILNGQIWIVNTRKGKGLVLNTVKKTGKICPASKGMLDIYDAFRNFKDRVDFSVEKIGRQQIGDKQAIGFKLKKENENREIIVWADAKSKLPIIMEENYENSKGQVVQYVITDIVFDGQLDELLFSLEPPEGYELTEFEYDDSVIRLNSTVNMDRILKACKRYVNEHKGRWPDSLRELSQYGLDKEVFTNPRQPTRKLGYVYLKPSSTPSESRIVLYEAYDEWDSGINVGFANYHVQFIKEESDFKNRIKEP